MRDPIWSEIKTRGYSRASFARLLGYRPAYVRLLACGARRPSREFQSRAAHFLGMAPTDLFHDHRLQVPTH